MGDLSPYHREMVAMLTEIGEAFSKLKDSADPVDQATVTDLMYARSDLLVFGVDDAMRVRMRALRRRLRRRGL